MDKMPQKRLFLYSGIALFLPFFFLFFHFKSQFNKIEKASDMLDKTAFCYFEKEKKQALNKACRKIFSKNPLSLEKELENLVFLKKERTEIEKLLKKESFFGSPELEKRLNFLNDKENRLSFIEIATTAKMGVQETVKGLSRAVEIDTQDLKQILGILEGSFPQYLVLDFQLNRALKDNGNEVLLLNFKMCRREFL